ncbi:MAG: hypothetical protein H6733_10460 [Alphaproteobacteria bacterium]|nr:hypothetical protein [Alphaproteobacteria bacterium]
MLPCPPRAPILAVLVSAVAVVGCTDWPRADHLPEVGDVVSATSDPRTAARATWTSLVAGDDDQPPGFDVGRLDAGRGVVLRGTLDGTGWWDDGTPIGLVGTDCGSVGTRVPAEHGDWTGDVDVHSVTPGATGALCVDLWTDATDVGLDAPVAVLDACGVPVAWIGDPDPAGLSGRAPHAAWRHPVRADEALAVVAAAFVPNDADRTIAYALSLSVVVDGPCPLPSGSLP